MKILIVEDEEVLLKVLIEKFEKDKFTVDSAVDGEKAMERVKASKPDLILLDIILPKKNGVEVLRDLKDDPELKDIPVIIISNLGADEKIKEALALGAADYLVKTQHPINEVVERVRSWLLKAK
ncbi:MAG: response regulator [Candidatus Magasanikbacteria bacterium]|nr:response regulator [Candidatus Magasanikbacteria bacterium]